MKKLILGIFIGLAFISSLLLYRSNYINKDKEISGKTYRTYLDNGNGDYDLSNGKTFPTDGYVLNTEKTKCDNGSKITQNEDKSISVNLGSSDVCSLYFDKTEWDFDYTGDVQNFVANKDGKYSIELWGAAGATKSGEGNAGYTAGTLNLKKDDTFYIYVGEAGKEYQNQQTFTNVSVYNGIPTIEKLRVDAANILLGGGATDIRKVKGSWNNFDSLKSRIMVAAGSGGQSYSFKANSSYGGGLHGGDGTKVQFDPKGNNHLGYGATQTKGGKGASNYISGSFGYTTPHLNNDGTGGNGYYGGGSGQGYNADAGGGSSFISGHNGCVAITEDSTEGNIKQRLDSNGNTCTDGTTDITCSYHYSGYIFTNTKMIDGEGYNWTTEKGEYVGQPQPDGSITEGHSGNGYARIKYIGNN